MTIDPRADDRIPNTLPLLDALVSEWAPEEQPFRRTTAILLQHQTGTMPALVRTLLRLGVDPRRCFFIDIPYSAHREVRAEILRLGLPPENLPASDYRPGQPLRPYQLERSRAVVARAGATLGDGERLLVLDDGSFVTEALSASRALAGRASIVEQTVFGIRKVRELPAIRALMRSVPLVNVAESRPKKSLEAGFLGRAIARSLLRSRPDTLQRLQRGRTLVMGFGAIGAAVVRALLEAEIPEERVRIVDPSASAQRRATAAGLAVWSRENADPPLFDVVIGCSGRSAFRPEDVRFLADGAILASASSGTVEFSRDELLALAADDRRPDVSLYPSTLRDAGDVHAPLEMRVGDRELVILNSGFPVDFDGSLNPVPCQQMQLTRALMVGGALQAAAAETPGPAPLSADLCQWIEDRYRAFNY